MPQWSITVCLSGTSREETRGFTSSTSPLKGASWWDTLAVICGFRVSKEWAPLKWVREPLQSRIRRIGHGDNWFPRAWSPRRESSFDSGRCVRHEYAVGEGTDETVPRFGKRSRDSFVFRLEGRQNQQAAAGKGGLEFGFEVHADDATSRNPDHWLPTSE